MSVWTPRELIESLQKWDQDQPIEVAVEHRGIGDIHVSLVQEHPIMIINLTDKD